MSRPECCKHCGRTKRYHDYRGNCGLFPYDGDSAALMKVPNDELRELSNLDLSELVQLCREAIPAGFEAGDEQTALRPDNMVSRILYGNMVRERNEARQMARDAIGGAWMWSTEDENDLDSMSSGALVTMYASVLRGFLLKGEIRREAKRNGE